MIKLTHDTLRELYIRDLALPDTFHGRTSPKVRNPQHWKNVKSFYNNEPLVFDRKLLESDRDIWVWSDIHWGHKKICEYAGRPFPSVGLMNDCLIGNYLNVVKPNDIVIFGGDIGFLSENNINEILSILPGYKIHIVGNHDMHRDGKVYQLATDERHVCMVIDVETPNLDYQLLFSHYPIDNVPSHAVNVHGHIHQNLANPWNINICVEHTNYAPRNLKDVMLQAQTYLESK